MTIPATEITNDKELQALVDGATGGLPWDSFMAIPTSADFTTEEDQLLLLGLVNRPTLLAEWQAFEAIALGEAQLEDERVSRERLTKLHALRAEARRMLPMASTEARPAADPAPLPPDQPAPVDQPNPALVAQIARQFANNRMPAVRRAGYLAGFILSPPPRR